MNALEHLETTEKYKKEQSDVPIILSPQVTVVTIVGWKEHS